MLTNGLQVTKEYRIASNYAFAVTLRYENTGPHAGGRS